MKLNQCIAIVTGGASGMGKATVEAILQNGGKAAVFDYNDEKGQSLCREYPEIIFFKTDIRDEAQVQNAVNRTVQHFGYVNVLVNCAGVGGAKRVLGKNGVHPLSFFEDIVNINLVGTFNMIRLAAQAISNAPAGEEGERGVIISTASFASTGGQIGQAAYAASKGGIVSMTLPVARELAMFGIRCNTISPGIVDTPMFGTLPPEAYQSLVDNTIFPKRLGKAEEFASLALEIIRNVLINGANIGLDGAVRLQPK